MLAILFAILTGVCIVVTRMINASLADKIGMLQGTFFNYMIGLICTCLLLPLETSTKNGFFSLFSTIPWWAYSGGLIGVIVILLSNYITPKISALYLTILIFISQLLVGILLDSILTKQIPIGDIIGGSLVFIGFIYNILIDQKN